MAAHPSTSPSQVMCLLQYTPRADSADRDYEPWLRAVDNPFFNGIPGIARYENWKVHTPILGQPDYTYFDLMYIESKEAIEKVWTNPELQEFAAEWTRLWGIVGDPTIDQAVNYHVSICEEIAGPIVPKRTEWALFFPYVRRDDAVERGYDAYLRDIDNPFFNSADVPEVVSDANWRKSSEVVGSEWWTDFDLMMIDGPEAATGLFANPKASDFIGGFIKQWGRVPEGGPADNFSGVLAELVASPDKK
jgi:hypothetical protein